jgi:hypothetical protein
MLSTSKLFQIGAICLVLCLSGTVMAGQKHSGYSRTMDDLRLARTLLQRPGQEPVINGSEDEVSLTIGNIDAVMAEIEKEIGPDRKKSRALPRINPRMKWGERLNESLKLIEMAELDCNKEKDGPSDAGLQARVFNLLDQAHTRMTVAIETINFDYNARNLPTRND